MKYLLLLMLVVTSSCAQESDRHVRCAPFIKMIDDHRVNGFWDLERDVEIDVSQCDEIIVE